MGEPPYRSTEWKAELERLRPLETPARMQASTPKYKAKGQVPESAEELTRALLLIATRQAAGLPHELHATPGQRRERHTKEQQAAARRLYRWLWRTFPGQLRTCDDELRELIRRAGGIA